MRHSPHAGLALALTGFCVVAAVACGGKEVGDANATVSGSGGANGTDGGGLDAGADVTCTRYFDSVIVPCGVSVTSGPYWDVVSRLLPESEFSRIEGRFKTYCAARLALPGTGFDAASVSACVSAVESFGCSAVNYAACTLTGGTLPAGAPCVRAEQCSTGACLNSGGGPFTGPPLPGMTNCGTCAPNPPPLGAPCAAPGPIGPPGPPPTTLSSCGPNAVCDYPGTGVCVSAHHTEGQRCNSASMDLFKQCADGLSCESASSTCRKTIQAGAGETCWSPDGPQCRAPLVCRGSGAPPSMPMPPPFAGHTCQTPGTVGTPCDSDAQCAEGLGCGQTRDCTSDPCTCDKVTFAAPGDVCGRAIRCLHGGCPATGDRCPDVIQDGAACDPAGPPGGVPVCDTFASCIDGKCSLGLPVCN